MAMPTQLESLITNAPQITQTQAMPIQTGAAATSIWARRRRSGGKYVHGQYPDALMKDAAKPTYTSTAQAMSSKPKVFTGSASTSFDYEGVVMTKKVMSSRATWPLSAAVAGRKERASRGSGGQDG